MEGNITNIIFISAASIIMVCYLYVIFLALYGWYKVKQTKSENKIHSVKLSLLIPFRNERKNLPELIKSIKEQTIQPFEIIFIDDHSTDNGGEIISGLFTGPGQVKLITCNNDSSGKKAALMKGLEMAKGDWILQTDADCILPERWVETFVGFISENPDNVFVAGPVKYSKGKSFFSWFFELDFISLVFTGAGFIGAGRPVFCNGANMAYKREEALNLKDPYFSATSSGDDVFLMQQLASRRKNGIVFLKNLNSIVKTNAPVSVSDFIKQRARWGSKAKYYKSNFALIVSLSVLLTNIALPLLYIPVLLGFMDLIYAIIFSALKIIADVILLLQGVKYFKRNDLFFLIIPALLVYPFYIAFVMFALWFSGNKWKSQL